MRFIYETNIKKDDLIVYLCFLRKECSEEFS